MENLNDEKKKKENFSRCKFYSYSILKLSPSKDVWSTFRRPWSLIPPRPWTVCWLNEHTARTAPEATNSFPSISFSTFIGQPIISCHRSLPLGSNGSRLASVRSSNKSKSDLFESTLKISLRIPRYRVSSPNETSLTHASKLYPHRGKVISNVPQTFYPTELTSSSSFSPIFFFFFETSNYRFEKQPDAFVIERSIPPLRFLLFASADSRNDLSRGGPVSGGTRGYKSVAAEKD